VHYAKTLQHWERRFEANRARIAAMYDELFCRNWEFYLLSAEMMFLIGSQLFFQMQLVPRRVKRMRRANVIRSLSFLGSTRGSPLARPMCQVARPG